MTQFEEDGFLLAATGYTGHTCLLDDSYDGFMACQECHEEIRRERTKDDIRFRVNHIENTSDDIFEIAKKERKKWQI